MSIHTISKVKNNGSSSYNLSNGKSTKCYIFFKFFYKPQIGGEFIVQKYAKRQIQQTMDK